MLYGLNDRFEVVIATRRRRVGFQGWGMEGPDSRSPCGIGKDSGEVWLLEKEY